MAVVMLVFISRLSEQMLRYEVNQDLYKQLRRNIRKVSMEDGELVFAEGYQTQINEIHVLVIDMYTGEIVSGTYPEGFPTDVQVYLKKKQTIINHREVYYVRKRYSKKRLGGRYVMVAVVRRSEVYSRYRNIERLAYLCVLAVFAAAVIAGIVFARKLSESLKSMCQTAESIGGDRNMSRRMEYEGPFYELQVLTGANNRMLDRLNEDFRQQEQFTSNVAHELRTPVAVMLAECQYTHDKPVSMEEYHETIEVLERQTRKLNEIIEKLLNLSRLDQGRLKIQREDVDLREIIESVCEELLIKYSDKVEIRQNLAEVHTVGDISLIMLAIQNLVSNAVKFSPEGGVVDVETGIREDGVYVSVRDQGIGMTPEQQSHIFERFYKADKSRNSEGFGLGLPLTLKIAQVHGGTVTVQSSPGGGSRFELVLGNS